MTPFDYAQRIVTVECTRSRLFVVKLTDQIAHVNLSVSSSSQQADHIALVARKVIAGEVARAMRDEACHCGADIDQAYLSNDSANRIWLPTQAAQICRDLAARAELNRLANAPIASAHCCIESESSD